MGTVFLISCRCGTEHYLCAEHSEKFVKEVQTALSKVLVRKGDNCRTPLERACIILGHQKLGSILQNMGVTGIDTVQCNGKLQVSEKVVVSEKKLKKRAAQQTAKHNSSLPSTSSIMSRSPGKVSSVPSDGADTTSSDSQSTGSSGLYQHQGSSVGETHRYYKTVMCKYGESCAFGDRCSYAHHESEIRGSYACYDLTGNGSGYACNLPEYDVPDLSRLAQFIPGVSHPPSQEFHMKQEDFPDLNTATSGSKCVESSVQPDEDDTFDLSELTKAILDPGYSPVSAPISTSSPGSSPQGCVGYSSPERSVGSLYGNCGFTYGGTCNTSAASLPSVSSTLAVPYPQQQCSTQPGIDGDAVQFNTFPVVEWLRHYGMGVYLWSGNVRCWTEYAMHIPSSLCQFIEHNLQQLKNNSGCEMWLDSDFLSGHREVFLVMHRGEDGEPSNIAMLSAMNGISQLMESVYSPPSNGIATNVNNTYEYGSQYYSSQTLGCVDFQSSNQYQQYSHGSSSNQMHEYEQQYQAHAPQTAGW